MKKMLTLLVALTIVGSAAQAIAHGPAPGTERHFKYCVPGWPNQVFGPKLDNLGLAKFTRDAGCKATDLTATSVWPAHMEKGVHNVCHLASFGKNPDDPKGGDYAPFEIAGNNPKYEALVRKGTKKAIEEAAKNDPKMLLAFTGMDTKEFPDNAERNKAVQYARLVLFWTVVADGETESLIEYAERLGVTVVVEMLNTRGNPATWKGHPGYLGDSTDDVVNRLIKPVNSKNFLLAFDIYHVVMMGEDPMEKIKQHHMYIGMVHAAGVVRNGDGFGPENRGELDAKGQVIDYAKVMAFLAQYYDGWVDLEYIPNTDDAAKALANILKAIAICESKIEK